MTAIAPVLLSWSGGKDSAWALHVLRQRSDVHVVGLVTTITDDYQRVSMQGIRLSVLHAQAIATGLPVIEARIQKNATNPLYEQAFATALTQARQHWPQLTRIAFGDLFLADIRQYREALCARYGWTPLFPLFGQNTTALSKTMHAHGLRAHLCCIDTQQLDQHFAGHPFDSKLLRILPDTIDPCGENGEFHTCTYAGPMFSKPLQLARGETILKNQRFAYTDFKLV